MGWRRRRVDQFGSENGDNSLLVICEDEFSVSRYASEGKRNTKSSTRGSWTPANTGYQAKKAKPNHQRLASDGNSSPLISSIVRLPAVRLTLTSAARMQRTMRPLDQMRKLRVDAHGRGNLHLLATFDVDWELRTKAHATRLSERPDFLLWAVGCAGVLAGRRHGCWVQMGWVGRRGSGGW